MSPTKEFRYPLSLSDDLKQRAAQAANKLEMPLSVWFRQAMLEKLERDGAGKDGQS